MEHLYNYSLEELTEYFKSINEKPFRAKQVFQWLYQKNAFESYALPWRGSGVNQHTWRTSKIGYDT